VTLNHNTSDVEVHTLLIVGDDVVERHLFQLIFRVAQRAEEGVVGVEHTPTLRIYEEDVLLRLLDHRAVERLALPQGLLLVLALRYVHKNALPEERPALRVPDQHGLLAHPHHPPVA
jgi:hypothetical protein